VAPFTVTPMPGSITAIVSPNEPASSSGVTFFTALRLTREEKWSAPSPASPKITYRFR